MPASLNTRHYNNKELLLFPSSIGDYLTEHHLAHVVDEAVEEIDLRSYYSKIPDVGNPSYEPKLMIKLWFYGYCTRTYSSSWKSRRGKIEEKLSTDIAFIYLSGMQKPDFKTISEFRRKNLTELKNSFVSILQICHRLGLTKLGEISIDSKVIKANASSYKTYDKDKIIEEQDRLQKGIEDYLEKVKQTDIEEDARYGDDKRGNELPQHISRRADRIKEMKRVAEQLKRAGEKLQESGKRRINLTDSDAQFQKDKGKKTVGYRAHIAVDSSKQVIIANNVTNEANDNKQLIPMIDETIKNTGKLKDSKDGTKEQSKIKVLADSGYSSGINLVELEGEKYRGRVEAYMPDAIYQVGNPVGARQRRRKENPFHKDKFIYNKSKDKFECPEGKILHYIGLVRGRNNQKVRVYHCKDCEGCKYWLQCTTSKKGRRIKVSENDGLMKKMREKLSTEEGKKAYSIRLEIP